MRKFIVVLLLLAVGFSSILIMSPTGAFARNEHRRGGHESFRHEGRRYNYYDGRWYNPGLFWFNFDFVIPPMGATVTYIPDRHRTFIIGGITYYEYDNVYYQPVPSGYVVVPQPVVTPNVVYGPAVGQPQAANRETVTMNIPTSTGGNIAITLVRYPNGFVGPQGEFYPTLPTTEQLRARYGR